MGVVPRWFVSHLKTTPFSSLRAFFRFTPPQERLEFRQIDGVPSESALETNRLVGDG